MKLKPAILAFAATSVGMSSVQAQLISGNLVIERMGGTTSAGTSVFVDQYNTTTANQSSTVNTLGMPAAATRPTSSPFNLVDSGSASSNGYLTRSANGLIIEMPGYNGLVGETGIAGSNSATISRTVGVIDGAGTVDTSRSYNMLSGNNYRSVVSSTGSAFYAAGAAGIVYTGTATSGTGTSISTANTRQVNLFNNTLFYSTGSGTTGIYQLGTAGTLPTSGTPTPQLIIATTSPYAFQFNTSMTTAYVANDSTGVQKWTLSGGTWSNVYTYSAYKGGSITVDWSNPTNPTFYALTATSAANSLAKIVDGGSVALSTTTTLATAAAGNTFRGVDQALLPSVWTSNTADNWSSTSTTTYNATIGAVVMASKNWSTGLVDGTNLAFQKVNAASLSLANNTSLTNVSSINFNGGGTVTGGQNTAYSLTGSALTLSGTSATSAIGTFTANSTTYTSVIANNSGVTQTVSIPLMLGAANQAFRASSGNLAINGTVANGGNTLTVGGAANTTFGSSAVISGSGGLTKVEAGTLTLNGNNTYNGATDVKAGKLVVTDTIGNSAVTVSGSGATLATDAAANIGSTLAINNGAILAVGDAAAAGTATVTGATTFNNGSIFSWDIDAGGTSYDKLITSGIAGEAAAGDAVFRIVASDGLVASSFWNTTKTWTGIFTTDGSTAVTNWATIFGNTVSVVNSSFQSITPVGGAFSVAGNTLTWTAVPEPTSALAGLLITAGLLRRRRPVR